MCGRGAGGVPAGLDENRQCILYIPLSSSAQFFTPVTSPPRPDYPLRAVTRFMRPRRGATVSPRLLRKKPLAKRFHSTNGPLGDELIAAHLLQAYPAYRATQALIPNSPVTLL